MALPWQTDQPLFSFVLAGRPSSELIARWNVETAVESVEGGTVTRRTWRDPESNLSVIEHIRAFDGFPASEILVEIENTGSSNSPILSEIMPVDIAVPSDPALKTYLHHAKGSDCRWDDFLPQSDELWEGRKFTLAPVGGRSSDTVLPFMNLQTSGGGIVIAIGWTGQWVARLERRGAFVHVASGMETTHLSLEPGERIRTPRVILIAWEGSDKYLGNNLLRRIVLEHYTPKDSATGSPFIPPVSHMTMSTFHATGKVSVEGELEALAKAGQLGCESYWVDACWFGSGKWAQETGQWTIWRDVFPDGLKPIGDAARKAGMGFILWFEPERVCAGTEIEREHPDLILRGKDKASFSLLNLGLPAAREFICERISSIISESGVTIYRQDFNFQPLPYWQAADTPDRIGMTEIRHIEGLYWLWDELRRRHPGLAIDNCASGGRRIDLETTMRSFPLWRSDFSDVGGPGYGKALQVACQVQTAGLSQWVPLHSASVWTFSPYDFRSTMSTGVTLYSNIRVPDFPDEDASKAIAELKRIRPFFLGDFYPLVPLTFEHHDWCAYQYHDQASNAGIAVFMRRHESPFPAMEAHLRCVDPSTIYEVSMSPGFDRAPTRRMCGAELAGLDVHIPEMPGSLLVEYRRL
jgi:alpha-galactosidase